MFGTFFALNQTGMLAENDWMALLKNYSTSRHWSNGIELKWKESVCPSIFSTTVQPIDFTLGERTAQDPKKKCRMRICLDEQLLRKAAIRNTRGQAISFKHVLTARQQWHMNTLEAHSCDICMCELKRLRTVIVLNMIMGLLFSPFLMPCYIWYYAFLTLHTCATWKCANVHNVDVYCTYRIDIFRGGIYLLNSTQVWLNKTLRQFKIYPTATTISLIVGVHRIWGINSRWLPTKYWWEKNQKQQWKQQLLVEGPPRSSVSVPVENYITSVTDMHCSADRGMS